MIRPATPSDVAAIVALGRHLHAESPRYRGLDYDAEKVARQAAEAVGHGYMLVAGDPVIGMACANLAAYLHSDALFGLDLVMYVHPDHRGRRIAADLVAGLEAIVGRHGAREMLLTISHGSNNRAVERFYRTLGYERVAVTVAKSLPGA